MLCVVELIPCDAAAPPAVTVHRTYNALTLGDVTLAYSQNDPLLRKVRLSPDMEDEDIYAALYTVDEVLLAETHDEVLAAPVTEKQALAGTEPTAVIVDDVPAPKKDKKKQ